MSKRLVLPHTYKWLRVMVLITMLCAIQWLESTHYHRTSIDHTCTVCQLVSHQSQLMGDDVIQTHTQHWFVLFVLCALLSVSSLHIVFSFSYSTRAPPPLN
ncbi:hypothetical protein LHV13_01180 [Ferrovum sp. PN-J185]|uniref:hypothetical protein n=1 Tax=Ferrovum sp. PN-J185 TaxID=1356306 RepID=UPI000796E878|nr:hypothetical protein [Ferrovum sp. PN-J185]KXW56143.1 hypothetical protein FV185_00870 [Ferrovum sp. PN-J185]MCC6067795.1 hypothetical protein [Ferrovum sp. PN-J185]MDE1892187.1 hypothetical protein [Betaproteobacteria bacterium]